MSEASEPTVPQTETDIQCVRNFPDFSKMDLKQSIIKRVSNVDEGGDNSQCIAKAGMARRLISVDETKPEEATIVESVPDSVKLMPIEQSSVEDHPDSSLARPPAATTNISRYIHKKPDPKRTCCCFKIYERGTDPHAKWPPKFHIRDVLFGLWALFTFAFDYGTDIRLMIQYVYDKQITWFILTACFIAVPSFISGIISVIWYKMTYERDVKYGYKHAKTLYYCRMAFSFIQLGRIFRQLEYIYCLVHSIRLERSIRKMEKDPRVSETEIEKERREVIRLRKTATADKRDAAILGLIDGFMESALQLMLQLYLTVQYSLPMDFPRTSSLVSSWISTAMIQTSYYRANRKANKDKHNADDMSSVLYFLWRFVELGPRYVVLILTAFYFQPWCLIAVPFHVIFVAVLYIRDAPELEGICTQPLEEERREKSETNPDRRRLLGATSSNGAQNGITEETPAQDEETGESAPEGCSFPSVMSKMFISLMAFVGLLSFINLKEGDSRKTSFVFYLVFYIENILMVALIVWTAVTTDNIIPWVYCLFAVPVGMVLHVTIVSLFYTFFHPNNSVCPPYKFYRCCIPITSEMRTEV